jgi:hypothetical protein
MNSSEAIGVQQIHTMDFAPDVDRVPNWLNHARLLQQWHSPATAWSTALEVALADLAGSPCGDGLFPWAAHGAAQLQLAGEHWAQLHLCHWHVSNGQVSLLQPQAVDRAALQALWAELADFVASDGLQLTPTPQGHALINGDCLQDLPTAALHKVMGRPVAEFLPPSDRLRRLQNELQMWLYTHPSLQGLQRPINSVWFAGTGRLTPPLRQLLQALTWSNGSAPTPGQRWLCASDTEASLWRIGGAHWGQRLWRRFQPLKWPTVSPDVD